MKLPRYRPRPAEHDTCRKCGGPVCIGGVRCGTCAAVEIARASPPFDKMPEAVVRLTAAVALRATGRETAADHQMARGFFDLVQHVVGEALKADPKLLKLS